MRKIETFVNEDNFTFSGGQKLQNFRKIMKLSQITVLELRTIFLKLCQNNYMHEISPILTFLHFKASESVVPIQPGDRSNVEETSYFIAGFAFHKKFKSVARFVYAATKKPP